MKLEFSRQIFEKHSNQSFQFHADGRTDGQTDMKKVNSRNFAKAPKIVTKIIVK